MTSNIDIEIIVISFFYSLICLSCHNGTFILYLSKTQLLFNTYAKKLREPMYLVKK